MLDYDPVKNLQHYPVSMSRFGLTPYNDCLYRIVFAPSRRYLNCCAELSDGSVGAKWMRLYPYLRDVWVMERWTPALEFHPPGKADWDMNCLELGPWPERGEYRLCHVFDIAPPADVNLDQLITLIEASRKVSYQETREWHHKDAAKQEAQKRATAEDMIRNALPAWGARPFAGAHGRRVTPLGNFRSANELGLPTHAGMRTGSGSKRIIEAAA